ncbi:MAG: tRNA threonylcarbamoyladenosine biosynthesis protein TsaE [Gammaproteobacteria bacterium SG8_31]|jgi:tRNA threonylcarbamoyladenosine biosynthesis protein TsaE|nr:MAG: tRNA threonylcarbamoyladenosine biosynthesis protein TsaE [Gammaproteobacteria bacterium SG8_31]
MEAFGSRLAQASTQGGVIFLQGELGAGKTTLVRGFVRALGYAGRVKSPTYTLLESYSLEGVNLYHLDLYRLADAEELEWIGIRDLLEEADLCLIEWPDRGLGVLPSPDLEIQIEYRGEGRVLQLLPTSDRGRDIVRQLDSPQV